MEQKINDKEIFYKVNYNTVLDNFDFELYKEDYLILKSQISGLEKIKESYIAKNFLYDKDTIYILKTKLKRHEINTRQFNFYFSFTRK